MRKKKIMILGATGSIGQNALRVIRDYKDQFEAVALSAHRGAEKLLEDAKDLGVTAVALTGSQAKEVNDLFYGYKGYYGKSGLIEMIKETDADIVLNAVSGVAGLEPSIAALESGKQLALANKETLVAGGKWVLEVAGKSNKKIIPVDSEHAALFELLKGKDPQSIQKIILTASGGPFRDYSVEQLKTVTVEQACTNPNWKMGVKISIDSATMGNKGLEIMEASILFDKEASEIEVLIHPTSEIHSFIQTKEGSIYAQIGKPDMKTPILNAFSYPEIVEAHYADLDLTATSFSFKKPSYHHYPLLKTAYDACEKGGGYPAAFNGANEAAVEAFIQQRIGFTEIAQKVEQALQFDFSQTPYSFEAVMEIDTKARRGVEDFLKQEGK